MLTISSDATLSGAISPASVRISGVNACQKRGKPMAYLRPGESIWPFPSSELGRRGRTSPPDSGAYPGKSCLPAALGVGSISGGPARESSSPRNSTRCLKPRSRNSGKFRSDATGWPSMVLWGHETTRLSKGTYLPRKGGPAVGSEELLEPWVLPCGCQ